PPDRSRRHDRGVASIRPADTTVVASIRPAATGDMQPSVAVYSRTCYRRLQIQGRGGALMTSESANLPAAVDRAAFQAELDALRVREKAHTREGDAIAAARRRLPMTEVPPDTTLVGADGEIPFADAFEGRDELVVYSHMFYVGEPPEWQCEGCTRNSWAMQHRADAAGIN